ncbi:lysophospholipid acyltransferase family protein [Spartinivicinus poritis]|uniref:Lysophospholipid acyltransferase family protein n=1 Tax=Spartinivicinus poritis TaxID=2994640 RepID=A0ABT5UBK1_9GAMM|nr:lysophospholipid acyltransferase family protein [Spartinivicinus sp. A2-2]MDE1463759.1 lysophospholipid acyltransferase family protein [Spartinivicinus sp. A2-2]
MLINQKTIFDHTKLCHYLGKIAAILFRLAKWSIEGNKPDQTQSVVVAAPHTSNWDFFITLGMALKMGVRVRWLGKQSLFKWGLGPLMRWLGGIPVDRSKSSGLVEQVTSYFKAGGHFSLVISPEGTRSKTKQWKTGFYYIAKNANVPINLAFIDHKKRVVGLGYTFHLTENPEKDLKSIKAFYTPYI